MHWGRADNVTVIHACEMTGSLSTLEGRHTGKGVTLEDKGGAEREGGRRI